MTRDITGNAPRKRSVTPTADALASFFTDTFCIPDEESAELPDLPVEKFDSVLKTFRVKKIGFRASSRS